MSDKISLCVRYNRFYTKYNQINRASVLKHITLTSQHCIDNIGNIQNHKCFDICSTSLIKCFLYMHHTVEPHFERRDYSDLEVPRDNENLNMKILISTPNKRPESSFKKILQQIVIVSLIFKQSYVYKLVQDSS